jgi:hypothetical protein
MGNAERAGIASTHTYEKELFIQVGDHASHKTLQLLRDVIA